MGKGAPLRKRSALFRLAEAVGLGRDSSARLSGRSLLRTLASRFPARAFVAGAFAAACAAAVFWGVPSPGVSPGDRADRTYVARVPFTAVDPARTAQQRQFERRKTPSVYVENEGWQDALLLAPRLLVDAAAGKESIEEARERLREAGVDLDPAPLREALRSPGGVKREDVLRLLEKTVSDLREFGVIADERMEAELDSGRRTIVTKGGRSLQLRDGKRRGVLALSDARGAIRRNAPLSFPPTVRPQLAGVWSRALASGLGPTLLHHADLTRRAREGAARRVADVMVEVHEGEIVVFEGHLIGATEYAMIRGELAAYHAGRSLAGHATRLLGVLLTVMLVAATLGAAVDRLTPDAVSSVRAVFFACALDLLVVVAARGLVVAGAPHGFGALLSPVALASIVLALVVSPLFAALNAAALAVLVALASGPDLAVPLGLAAGSVAGVLAAARARRRTELLRAGVMAGIVQSLAVAGVKMGGGVLQGLGDVTVLLEWGGWALVNGFACGLVALGLLPVAESAFGVTTDISLLELSDQNHAALKRLITEAPGTYHHSLIVGNLSEAAADALCETESRNYANALLARVASYYHDLGKVDRPEYFVENGPLGRSRHEGLSATMSTLIITSHVRDGVALGREYRLPRAILDVIRQHHGTSTVEFFYRQAVDRAARDRVASGSSPRRAPGEATRRGGEGSQVEQQLFRYAGPKPQTREAGIVLLADSVEAASRSLEEATTVRLSKLVHDLATKRLEDGQFDESGLTLRDIRTVEAVFVKVLGSMFHARVPYPNVMSAGPQAPLAPPRGGARDLATGAGGAGGGAAERGTAGRGGKAR